MNDHDQTVSMPIIKIASAWVAALGITSWGDFASFMAACYTSLLIAEWVYKKFLVKQQ